MEYPAKTAPCSNVTAPPAQRIPRPSALKIAHDLARQCRWKSQQIELLLSLRQQMMLQVKLKKASGAISNGRFCLKLSTGRRRTRRKF
jgi:hypothetical protein